MFRFIDQLRTAIVVLAAGAALAPAAADAAPVTLRYDFTAIVTSTAYFHICSDFGNCADFEADGDATTYQGPPVNSRGAGALTVSFDPDVDIYQDFAFSIDLPALFVPSARSVEDYDPVTQALSASGFNFSDLFQIDLNPEFGNGFASFDYEQDSTGADWAEVALQLYDVTVTDLSAQPVPVPLPAALPMLAAGLAGLGLLRRRRSRT